MFSGTPTDPTVSDASTVQVPSEIIARGTNAKLAYQNALRHGKVIVHRGRIVLIGEDRAGKTSLKKNLRGLSFDPQKPSTREIEVDPSKSEYDVDQVVVSRFVSDIAKIVAAKLREEETNMAQSTKDDPDQVSEPPGPSCSKAD